MAILKVFAPKNVFLKEIFVFGFLIFIPGEILKALTVTVLSGKLQKFLNQREASDA